MLTIVTVLRKGGEYGHEHVRQVRDGVARWLAMPHRFTCLTDDYTSEWECAPLYHGWPGWFSKIELFRPGLFDGPTLYLDLDTIITGPLDDIILGHRWTTLSNFWDANRIGSGLMAWDGSLDLSSIYDAFRADPEVGIGKCQTREVWGDQGFISLTWPEPPARWQTLHPGRVVSWKMDCKSGVPEGASIVCFHGPPRPWMTPLWHKG